MIGFIGPSATDAARVSDDSSDSCLLTEKNIESVLGADVVVILDTCASWGGA